MLTSFFGLSSSGPQVFSNVVCIGRELWINPQSGFWRAPSFVIGENCALILTSTRTNLKPMQLWPLIFCQGRSLKKISAPTPQKKKKKKFGGTFARKSEIALRASYESRQYYQRLWLEMGLVVGLSLSNGTSLFVLCYGGGWWIWWWQSNNQLNETKYMYTTYLKYCQKLQFKVSQIWGAFQSESSWGTPDTAFA